MDQGCVSSIALQSPHRHHIIIIVFYASSLRIHRCHLHPILETPYPGKQLCAHLPPAAQAVQCHEDLAQCSPQGVASKHHRDA